MENKTFHVSVSFDSVSAKNELEAAKKVAGWLKKDATDFIYEVMDEETEKEFTVDLSEEDEDSVLPNDTIIYTVKNNVENVIVGQFTNDSQFINFIKKIAVENGDKEFSIITIDDAKDYLNGYCSNLELY